MFFRYFIYEIFHICTLLVYYKHTEPFILVISVKVTNTPEVPSTPDTGEDNTDIPQGEIGYLLYN